MWKSVLAKRSVKDWCGSRGVFHKSIPCPGQRRRTPSNETHTPNQRFPQMTVFFAHNYEA